MTAMVMVGVVETTTAHQRSNNIVRFEIVFENENFEMNVDRNENDWSDVLHPLFEQFSMFLIFGDRKMIMD